MLLAVQNCVLVGNFFFEDSFLFQHRQKRHQQQQQQSRQSCLYQAHTRIPAHAVYSPPLSVSTSSFSLPCGIVVLDLASFVVSNLHSFIPSFLPFFGSLPFSRTSDSAAHNQQPKKKSKGNETEKDRVKKTRQPPSKHFQHVHSLNATAWKATNLGTQYQQQHYKTTNNNNNKQHHTTMTSSSSTHPRTTTATTPTIMSNKHQHPIQEWKHHQQQHQHSRFLPTLQ